MVGAIDRVILLKKGKKNLLHFLFLFAFYVIMYRMRLNKKIMMGIFLLRARDKFKNIHLVFHFTFLYKVE